MTTRESAELAQKLGVDIDPELLALALTHRSWAYENGGVPHNERLEFLGDSVLGQAVTVRLFRAHPELDEGALAKRRAAVVSTVALAEVARGIDLGAYVKLGRGEEQTGGREKDSILADTMEAVFGATYLSAGPDAASDLVLRLIEPLLSDPDRYGAAVDPKTALQELAARRPLRLRVKRPSFGREAFFFLAGSAALPGGKGGPALGAQANSEPARRCCSAVRSALM